MVALIWRSSAPPFATDTSARVWATLLALEKPDTAGARRIKDALDRLEDLNLVRVERSRGETSRVVLLREDGGGEDYELPSTAYRLSRKGDHTHHYFKVPIGLWTSGHMQGMSAAALAMLMVTLAESRGPNEPVWWSTEEFPDRYGLSSSMRARGTKELVDRGLLNVRKQLLADVPDRPFGRQRVRNMYLPTAEAAEALQERSAAPAGDAVLVEGTVAKPKRLKRARQAG